MTGYMPAAQTCEWETPQWFFDRLDQEFGFNLDPASTHENAKCDLHYTKAEDGLVQPWLKKNVFLNPPYGREIEQWLPKAWAEVQEGALVVALIPVRSDTRWWHDYVMRAEEIRLVRGRLRFVGASTGAPFPSVVVVWPSRVAREGPPRLSSISAKPPGVAS